MQGSRESAAASAAEVLRREQAALRQSKQLVPIILQSPGSSKAKLKAGPAANGGPTTGGSAKSLVHLNGGTLSKKSSLEALGRAGSQPLQEGGSVGNGSSFVDLASMAERPASAAGALHHRSLPAISAGSLPTAAAPAAPRSPAMRQGPSLALSKSTFGCAWPSSKVDELCCLNGQGDVISWDLRESCLCCRCGS